MFNTDNNNNNSLLFRNIKLMAKVLAKIDFIKLLKSMF